MPAPSRMPRWLDRTIVFLGSGPLAVWLLTILSVLMGFYLLLPQFPDEPDSAAAWAEAVGPLGELARLLQLTDVNTSVVFVAAYSLLFVNLSVCMIRRFRLLVAAFRFPTTPPHATSSNWSHRQIDSQVDPARVQAHLSQRGFRTLATGDTVYGLRGQYAMVGHWVFHFAMLALMVAGGVISLQADPFRGKVGVGEGEVIDLHTAPYLARNEKLTDEYFDALPPFQFRLERLGWVAEGDSVRDMEAIVSVPDGSEHVVRINQPFRSKPYQVMAHGIGYMPGWGLFDHQGQMVEGAWMKLPPFPQEQVDSFRIDRERLLVDVVFLADGENTVPVDSSTEPQDPTFVVKVVEGMSGPVVFQGTVRPGDRIEVSRTRALVFFPEVRRFLMLDIIEERSHPFVFAIFGFLIFGLALRYFQTRKEFVVTCQDGSLQVFGRSEMHAHLFEEEVDRLAQELGQVS